jgi:uncharacterized membrane protein YwzB
VLFQAGRLAVFHKLRLNRLLWVAGCTLYGVLLALILVGWTSRKSPDQYYFQAVSWLHGSNAIDDAKGIIEKDVIYVGDHMYIALGPFPAVLTVPFVLIFGDNYRNVFLHLVAVLITIWATRSILLKIQIPSASTHLWLLILFFLSTVYLGVAVQNGPWETAHLVACCLLFLGINEALGKGRPLLLGLYLGLSTATRLTTLFAFPFFALALLVGKFYTADEGDNSQTERLAFKDRGTAIRVLVLFVAGLLPGLLLNFGFNYVRFHDPFRTGYETSVLDQPVLQSQRASGLFSPLHIPKNLYYFFLAVPVPHGQTSTGDPADVPVLSFPYVQPSPWGMSIFLTTPSIIYVLRAPWRKTVVKVAWIATLMVALPIFMYYGVGWVQFGYRYALDFMPFLWLLIAIALRRHRLDIYHPTTPLWLIVAGTLVNLWGAYWLVSRGTIFK